MPISIAVSAFLFNCIMGLNGIYVGYFLDSDINFNATFIIGAVLFIINDN